MGRPALADEIIGAKKSAGYDVRESNPLEDAKIFTSPNGAAAPIARRIKMLWEFTRPAIIEKFPKSPGLPKDAGAYRPC